MIIVKFKFIQSNDKEEIIVYAKEKNDFINSIEKMCHQTENKLLGYDKDIIKELNPYNVECFYTSNNKIYAIYDNVNYLVKIPLYELESKYSEKFIYINQGCLANVDYIDHFEVNIGGSLLVVFKSKYKDYVSRRKIKDIKQRMGIK